MVSIYILKLQQGKYYVGKSNEPTIRIDSHFQSMGSEWTKIYPPESIIEIISDCDIYDEDKYTIKYMSQYGIENVRGGSFVQIKLEQSTIDHLRKMINGSSNNCFICGKSGHFAKQCPNKIQQHHETYKCKYCPREFITENSALSHEKCCFNNKTLSTKKWVSNIFQELKTVPDRILDEVIKCKRCGRTGHNETTCYANTHLKGYRLQ